MCLSHPKTTILASIGSPSMHKIERNRPLWALPLPIFEERGDIFVCACAFVLKNAKFFLLTLVACTIDFSSQSFECIRDALILYSCQRSISSLYMISPYKNRLFYLTKKDCVLPQIVYTNDQMPKMGSCLNLK